MFPPPHESNFREARLDMLESGEDLPPEALRHDATARTGGRECEDPLKERLRVLVGELQADQGSAVSLPILAITRLRLREELRWP